MKFDVSKDVAFVWSRSKQKRTYAERGLMFEDATKLFLPQANLVVLPSPRRGQLRFVGYGFLGTKLYTVAYEENGGVFRIISFRRANKREQKRYDKEISETLDFS